MDMKKFLAGALAVCLTGSLAVTAGAVGAIGKYTPNDPHNITSLDNVTSWDQDANNIADKEAGIGEDTAASHQIPIKITTVSQNPQHVLAASVDKTELTFHYTFGELIWDPVTLQYVQKNPEKSAWTGDGELTVTNYSDVAVTVTATTEGNELAKGVTMTLKDKTAAGDGQASASLNIPSAYKEGETAKNHAEQGTFVLKLTGVPDPAVGRNGAMQIGTMTLELKKALQ